MMFWFNPNCVLWIIVYCLFWIYISLVPCLASGKSGILWEYCLTEIFNPSCSSDEVIIMESALFGQMHLGRCVDEDFGYLGCSANELGLMDKKCSGRQSCEVSVASIKSQLNCSIPKTLTQYLEARYMCKKVLNIKDDCQVTAHGKHMIASSKTTDCGKDTTPYIITAKTGQKINISLTDFNWNPVHENIHGCVQRYGYIIDVNNNEITDICGKTKRLKHVLMTVGNYVQIVFQNKIIGDVSFLLEYEVIGCPRFETPKDTWTKEEQDMVTVGCLESDKKWKMRCIGNHWIGIMGNCTKEKPNIDMKELNTYNEDYVFGMPPVIGFSLIGGIFLVILCVTMTTIIGFFCIKKPKPQQKEYFMTTMPFSHNMATMNHNMNGTIGPNQTLLSMGQQTTLLHPRTYEDGQPVNHTSPHYFILENKDQQNEPVYDAVYQNITDGNSV